MQQYQNRRTIVRTSGIAALGVALNPAIVAAQATPSASPVPLEPLPDEVIDAVRSATARAMAEEGIPGAAIHLTLPGYVPFAEPYGVADKSADTPVTMETHFRIGSITKTFVGTLILQLVDEGRFSLDDTIDTWHFDVPHFDRITVRNLLNMTSGLQNYTATEEFASARAHDTDTRLGPDDYIAMASGESLSKPGASYQYNNTNYLILGRIAELVTGQSLEQLLRSRLWDPLGMMHTGLGLDASLPDPHARGYAEAGAELPEGLSGVVAIPDDAVADVDGQVDVTGLDPSWAWAAGGAWSTVGDLAIWLPALLRGETLSPELLAQRMEWVTADPNNPSFGGYGLGIFSLGGVIGHNGGYPGFSSFIAYEPNSGMSVVILTNLFPGETLDPTPESVLLSAIAEQVLLFLET